MTPVMMPGSACGSTIRLTPCQRVPPRLALTVLNSIGTARNASSAARDHHRQRHDRQGERAGQDRCPEAEEDHEHPQPEQPVHDRRNARQVHQRQADRAGQFGVPRIFGKIDRPADAERDRDHGGGERQDERAHDGRPDAARLHAVARHPEDEIPADRRDPLHHHHADHVEDGHHHHQRGRGEERIAGALDEIAALRVRRNGLWPSSHSHQRSPPRRRFLKMADVAARLIRKVIRKRMMPIPNST